MIVCICKGINQDTVNTAVHKLQCDTKDKDITLQLVFTSLKLDLGAGCKMCLPSLESAVQEAKDTFNPLV